MNTALIINLQFGNYLIEIERLDGYSKFIWTDEFFGESDNTDKITLGNDYGLNINVYTIKTRVVSRQSGFLYIKLFCIYDAIPSIMTVESFSTIAIGYDKSVALVNVEQGKIVGQLQTESLFYYFLWSKNDTRIYAIFEIKIICMDILGNIFWQKNTDIISYVNMGDEYLVVKYLDGIDEKISCETGNKLD
ncbi:MAG TPA: hypothetical protein PK299_14885 [Anaerolineales bacterium]|nr:hypothetical protein [Anaerolineales bacterium]